MQQASTHFSISSPRPCVLYAKTERMEYVHLARGRVQSPMGGSMRTLNAGQNYVAHGHLPGSPGARPASSPPAAGCRPPVSHHFHVGAMVPEAMAHSPSFEGTNYHRGWDRPSLLLDVTPSSHRAVHGGSPPRTAHRSNTASRLPISPAAGGNESPPPSDRSYREVTPRTAAARRWSHSSSPPASPPTPLPAKGGGSWMNLPVTTGVRGRERDVSPPQWGAAGMKPPASDHLMVGRGCSPAVGLRDSSHGGGGGVFFPGELQRQPSALWATGSSRPTQQLRASPTRLFSF